jgi:hypothetical protein
MKKILLVLLLACAAPARADVTVECSLTIQSVAGTGEGRVTTETSGLKRREDRRLVLAGPFASATADTVQSSIIRLDRAVVQQLASADSTYQETPLSQVLAKLHGSEGATLPGLDGGSNLDVTWTVSSAKKDEHATIAGYDATPTVLTLQGKGTQKETGQPIELVLTLELWTASGVPGAAEIRTFDSKYAAAVGLAPGAVEESMAAFGVSRSAVRQLSAARAKVSGTPVRTVMSVAMPSLSDMMKKLSESMPGSTGSTPQLADGPLLTSTLEVVRVDTTRLPAARFQVPAGFKRRT